MANKGHGLGELSLVWKEPFSEHQMGRLDQDRKKGRIKRKLWLRCFHDLLRTFFFLFSCWDGVHVCHFLDYPVLAAGFVGQDTGVI